MVPGGRSAEAPARAAVGDIPGARESKTPAEAAPAGEEAAEGDAVASPMRSREGGPRSILLACDELAVKLFEAVSHRRRRISVCSDNEFGDLVHQPTTAADSFERPTAFRQQTGRSSDKARVATKTGLHQTNVGPKLLCMQKHMII